MGANKVWTHKMGSWWVKADQVSKTTPEGEYLTTGGVFVSGAKNPLPPAQMVLGFATLFQISEDSVKHHRKLRDSEDDHDAGSDPEDTNKPGVDEQLDQQDHLDSTDLSVETEEHTAAATTSQLSGQTELKVVAQQQQKDSDTPVDGHAGRECDAEQGGSTPDDSGSEESSAEADESHISSLDNQNANTSTKPSSANSSPAPIGGKANQHVRGKRGKNKKIAEKYKWQDEEDKALALRLLGSASVSEQASSPAGKSKSAQVKTKEQREAESEARLARRRAQHEKAAQAERERLQRLRNGVQDMNESVETADMSMLPCLVGSPKVEDEVVGAIPICAPWTALATFKYKTKIQPGPLKRGKAVKEMIGRWVFDAEMAAKIANKSTKKNTEDNEAQQETPSSAEDDLTTKTQANSAANELELLKAWKDTEGVNCVPASNMRIVSGAGDKTSKGKGKGGSATKKEKPSKGAKKPKGSKKRT
ncbi:hypothetical protein KEM56_002275 [Ascosphaera pollenicola]|nr:hypothetical protein KEM56_002275 [Ascosphaera pollenicola]